MSKNIILKNHVQLEQNIEESIKYGLKLIELETELLNSGEKTIVIEGLLLRACAYWEKFLEAEVIYLIEMDKSKLIEELELPCNSVLSRKIIKSILFSNVYRDFHDIEKSKTFFRTFITDNYNLFKKLTNEQIKKTQTVYKLRNYLVHYSEFSKRKLQQEYINNYKYSVFTAPGKFLIKSSGKHFEKLIHNFSIMSATMKKDL